MDRDELIELVERIMRAEGADEEEADALVGRFEANVPHPAASDLIFYPDAHFGHEPTAEEVVDRALSYRPLEM